MQKEILVVDIDGTLTNDKDITLKVKEDLEELKNNYHIIFNTGRSVNGYSKLELLHKVNEMPYSLLNGAIICDSYGDVKKEFVISSNESSNIIKLLLQHPEAIFHVETDEGFFVPNFESTQWNWAKEFSSVHSIFEYKYQKTYKIALHLKNGCIPYEKIVEYCREKLKINRIDNDFVDICHKQANKGNAVRIIMNYLWRNISNIEILACGDSWNDLSMFEVADISIAVGNNSIPASVHVPDTNALISFLKRRIQEKEKDE